MGMSTLDGPTMGMSTLDGPMMDELPESELELERVWICHEVCGHRVAWVWGLESYSSPPLQRARRAPRGSAVALTEWLWAVLGDDPETFATAAKRGTQPREAVGPNWRTVFKLWCPRCRTWIPDIAERRLRRLISKREGRKVFV